ncbi:uncharacterized protein [Spinacia oleracea]|uniref:Major facilitator superfamily (MFS) profile domain-containing protein n=1 Tax=Spinacia oleracea TaxID=3562 RepID=A0ABM3RPD7_SPIOL|nr:uncharacterized protein LOC110803985 [Spinacia oleracea]
MLLKLEKGPLSNVDVDEGSTTINLVLIYSIFTAVCGSFVIGFATGYTSPVQSGIIADMGLTIADYSLFASILTIGGLISSLLCGKLTDYIGRRGVMGLSSTLFLIGWLAIAFSQHAWSLDLGRLALGMAGGLNIYVVPVYIAEITPRNLRGGAVLLHQLMISCGLASAYIVGLVTNWRVLALIGALPCLVQLFGLFVIPESPRWLVKVGQDKGYEVALKSLRGKNMDIFHEAAEIKECIRAAENISEDKFLSVFQRKYASSLTVCVGLMALSGSSGAGGIIGYATATFESAGFSGTVGTVAMALTQLPPTILGVFLMDKFGRRPLLLYSAVGMCTTCFLLALSFLMKEHGWMKDFSPYLALIGILISAATFPVGLGAIPGLIMSEIFPMNVKGAAGSLAIVVSSLCGWIVSYTFNFLMEWSSSGTFFIFMSINVFTVLFISKLVPETKGRTLEEIQESLSRAFYQKLFCSQMMYYDNNGNNTEAERPLIEIQSTASSDKGEGSVTCVLVFSIFVAVCGSFACGLGGGYSSPCQSAIIKDLHLSTADYSLFGSLLMAGGLLGALVCGKLTDSMGRRGSMGLSSILCLAGWLSIAYSQDVRSLYIGRLATGFSTGLVAFATPVYITEIAPKNIRGGLGLLHQLLMSCGVTVALLVGLVTSWRDLALIGTVPCMIQLLGVFFIPESPRWLVKARSGDEYEAALKRLRGKNTDISQEAAEIKEHTEAVINNSHNFFDVFQIKYAYALTVSLGLMALPAFGGTNAILFYASTIFESAGLSETVGTIAMGLIQLPPFALGVFLMDKHGRRPLLLFSAAGMAVACFLMALSFLFKTHGWMMDISPYFALSGILIFSATYPVGMGGIPSIIMSEIFPINIKGAAGTLATVVGNTSAWIVTYTFIFMMQWSSFGTFFAFSHVNITTLLFIAKLVPETKGRTLEDIQDLISYKGNRFW